MSGLDEETVARKVGVKPERLLNWERGDLRPTIAQLRKLSDTYKRPLAVFFLDHPPPDDPVPSDFRRFDPQAVEPLSPELRLQIRDARARREAALELYKELDEEPPQFKFAAKLSDDLEKVGERLRHVLAAGENPPGGDARVVFNFWRAAAERAGALVFQAENIDIEDMRGFSISERPLPVIVLNIKDVFPARSFSLFHELAHVALNRGGLCIFEERGPHTDIQRTEVFCNHVAGAALLPARLLLREPETPVKCVPNISDSAVNELAKRYGASRETVLRRLVVLNRVSARFYQRKRGEYVREHTERRRQRREGGFAPPYTMALATGGQQFARLVLAAYDEERITASDVAGYLGVRLKHIDRIREAVEAGAVIEGSA